MRGFETDRFIADCRAALAETSPEQAVREVVTRAVLNPQPLLEALGEPKRGGIQKMHVSPDLTVLNVIWPPGMAIMPHNHRMWAVIGVYTGREDNVFWRRLAAERRRIESAGAKSLVSRDALSLGKDIIHSVVNPDSRFTGALHIYGGDFFAVDRSEWDPGTLVERPYDMEKNLRLFEEAGRKV